MKIKKTVKKLTLNKTTIIKLNQEKLDAVKGGYGVTRPTYCGDLVCRTATCTKEPACTPW